jgi:hypothetical protein
MRFGTWSVRSIHSSGSVKEVDRKLAKYRLAVMVVQDVRWDKGWAERAEKYTFFYSKEMKTVSYEQDIFPVCTYRQVECKVSSCSDVMLRGLRCNVIVLNSRALTENKSDELKGSFYDKLEQIFDQSPKCRLKILLEKFSAKWVTEDINRQWGMIVYMKILMVMVVSVMEYATVRNEIVSSTVFS